MLTLRTFLSWVNKVKSRCVIRVYAKTPLIAPSLVTEEQKRFDAVRTRLLADSMAVPAPSVSFFSLNPSLAVEKLIASNRSVGALLDLAVLLSDYAHLVRCTYKRIPELNDYHRKMVDSTTYLVTMYKYDSAFRSWLATVIKVVSTMEYNTHTSLSARLRHISLHRDIEVWHAGFIASTGFRVSVYDIMLPLKDIFSRLVVERQSVLG